MPPSSAVQTKGYESTLSKHHGFVVRGIFGVAMKACPWRAKFFEKLFFRRLMHTG